MMRLELFVDDKKLAHLLHAIDGMVVQMAIGPVHNAKTKNGKVTEAGNPTNARELVTWAVNTSIGNGGKGLITTAQLRQAAKKFGIKEDRVHQTLFYMKEQRLIKRVGNGKYVPTTTGVK